MQLEKLLKPIRSFSEPLLKKASSSKRALADITKSVTHLKTTTANYHLRTTVMYNAANFIAADKIEGDYLEFGVFSGGAFLQAYICLHEAFRISSEQNMWNTDKDCEQRKAIWEKMRFFAFDSFEGLPEPKGIDKMSDDFVAGKFAKSEDDFKQVISSQGMPLEKVITVPGWFNESLTDEVKEKHNLRHAAVVYVDCDLYESTVDVLKFITPLLVDGSIIVFDDWFTYKGNPNLGEQRACREWLEANPQIYLNQYLMEGPWKNSFIATVEKV